MIHGHSAHLFQGIEFYKGKLILYDTGDFVDDYQVDPLLRNDRSFFRDSCQPARHPIPGVNPKPYRKLPGQYR